MEKGNQIERGKWNRSCGLGEKRWWLGEVVMVRGGGGGTTGCLSLAHSGLRMQMDICSITRVSTGRREG